MIRRLPAAVALFALLAGLSSVSPVALAQSAPEQVTGQHTLIDHANPQCDPLDPSMCLFPFPNDRFTVADPTTATGRRVDLSPLSTPRNTAGKPIDPTEWNRNDGFSPGSMLLTHVPGLDLQRTGAVGLDSLETYADPDQPIVVLDAATGERHPIWAELDSNANDPSRRALIVRPAVNFLEGHRYIAVLRDLRDASGVVIPPGPEFAAYLEGRGSEPDRQRHFDEMFETLVEADIDPASTFLVWDFTIASADNLAGRVLHIRDEAFAALGDHDLANLKVEGRSPTFTVDRVKNNPDDLLLRTVEGTFTVPYYLTVPSQCRVTTDPERAVLSASPIRFDSLCTPAPGSRFFYDPTDGDDLPDQTGVMLADYRCNIPKSVRAADGSVTPATPSLYGHGLLGGNGEVAAGNVRTFGTEHNIAFCATDWIGMATEDVPNVVTILPDMSNFPTLADRAQQGFLNQLFLGRVMVHPDGFASHPAFKVDGVPAIRGTTENGTSTLAYDGNSQGGIMGGALTAIAPDFTRAVLGVPGMNYSTLLNRSVDWDPYSVVTYQAYPDKMTQQLVFALIQMLWDRAEGNGYAQHMTDDPYPNTPAHQVLLHVAFADHQVAIASAEVQARTIGAHLYEPAMYQERATGRYYGDDFWGIPGVPTGESRGPGGNGPPGLDRDDGLPPGSDNGRGPDGNGPPGLDREGNENAFTGSVFVMWDSGNPPPPIGNVPPRDDAMDDPHGHPRATLEARLQKAAFMLGGFFLDTCYGKPCLSLRHPDYQVWRSP